MFESLFYDQLDKQNEFRKKILNQYLCEIAKKYNLSEKEVSEILFKYYGECLIKRKD